MSSEQLAVLGPKASDQLATFLGIEKGMMLETLKVQCFKGKRPDEISDTQLAAFVSTANVLQVNPLVPGMLYAYPERNGGITPILGPDGVFKKLDEFIASGKLRGFECDVKMGADGKPDSATAIIHRGGDNVPAKYTAYYSEWAVTSNPNWQARPRHMLWVRAIKQAARQVIHGLPMDADEYEIAKMQNVTPEEAAPVPERPTPPKREAKGAAKVRETVRAASPEIVVPAEPATVTTVAPEPTPATVTTPEPKVETFAQAASATEPAPAVSEPVATPDAAKPAQRAFLTDGEIIDVVCKVKDVTPFNAKIGDTVTPSVQANVGGGYFGTVFAIGAATADGDKLTAKEPWVPGREVKLKLRGKHSAKLQKVQVVVDAAEAVAEEF